MIKVMRNAQKILRRDPDLMTVMQINISDSDITNTTSTTTTTKKKEEPKKIEKKESKPVVEKPKPPVQNAPKPGPPADDKKKKGYGNLFG